MEIIHGNFKEKEPIVNVYGRAIVRFFGKHSEERFSEDRDTMKRFLFLNVKFLGRDNQNDNEVKSKEYVEDRFVLFKSLTDLMSLLTPREFTQMFPIKKTYSGEKYQVRDYFSTMEAVKKIGMDNVIGDQIFDFLMDYHNCDITLFEVAKMLNLSDMRRLEGHKGLMEEFMESLGVPSYTVHKKEGYMTNNLTGKAIKVHKPKMRIPKHLEVL